MTDTKFRTFGELYRAAYAEPNPERKAFLLSEVRRALDEWERGLHATEIAIRMKASQVADTSAPQAIMAA